MIITVSYHVPRNLSVDPIDTIVTYHQGAESRLCWYLTYILWQYQKSIPGEKTLNGDHVTEWHQITRTATMVPEGAAPAAMTRLFDRIRM